MEPVLADQIENMTTSRAQFERLMHGETLGGHFMMPLVKQFCTINTGAAYGAYSQDYRVMTRCQIQIINRLPIDVFNVLGYPYREAGDCGLQVTFPHDDQPYASGVLIEKIQDIDRIHWPAPSAGRLMRDRMLAVREFRRLRPDIVVMGACESPFAQVNTLMGIERTMMSFFDDTELLRASLRFTEEHELRFALAQIEAGADMIFVGDSLASQISRELYGEFLVESEIRFVQAIQSRGVPVRWHVCGDCTAILPDLARTGAKFLDIDFPVDLSWACETVAAISPGSYVVGNLHPVAALLNGCPKDVRAACRDCERRASGYHNFILAPGCEVPPHTPPENYRALIEFGWRFTPTDVSTLMKSGANR